MGTDRGPAAFAVEVLRRRWTEEGRAACPDARRLLITADGGGSNSFRVRAWKPAPPGRPAPLQRHGHHGDPLPARLAHPGELARHLVHATTTDG